MAAVSWSDDDLSDGTDSEELPSPQKREVELEKFRKEWRGEIVATSAMKQSAKDGNSATKQDLAAELFEKGVKEERRGRMYEAIKFYRDAVHLVPDIEQKMAQKANWAKQDKSEDSSNTRESSVSITTLDDLLYDWDKGVNLDEETKENSVWRVCSPERDVTNGAHFSSCPPEVVVLILRWVVSRDLDIRSLDLLGEVCHGFYQASRDPEIWKRICLRVFGASCELPDQLGFSSWRDLYLQLPHPLFHGCYINKVSYIRHGENSFQDQFYRPWYQVEYFRFLRFFPEGRCLMLTTPEEPSSVLHHLKSRYPKLGTMLCGHYRLHGDTLLASMKRVSDVPASNSAIMKQINRARRNRSTEEISEKTFYLEVQLKNWRGKRNMELGWIRYSVRTYYPEREVGSTTDFELSSSSFPPFRFSRVRSYAAVSDFPLDD